MDNLGNYRIAEEIGRGGMGVVYRAEDPIIGRSLAVKVIDLSKVVDPAERDALRERLFREARSAGNLSHPGIVTIHQVAEHNGLPYIAMEYVSGVTLEKLMSDGLPVAAGIVRPVIKQTAAALDYAHRKGIVHRDIKPANLMLNEDGWIKICDFGIAKMRDRDHSMTQTGTVLGTPQYMSPEQLKGATVDGRTDQYSLAAVTYQMVTGEKLFNADTIETLLCRILYEDPAPLCERLGFSPGLPRVLTRALSKEPAERYQSCREFAQDFLEAYKLTPNPQPLAPPIGPDTKQDGQVGAAPIWLATEVVRYPPTPSILGGDVSPVEDRLSAVAATQEAGRSATIPAMPNADLGPTSTSVDRPSRRNHLG